MDLVLALTALVLLAPAMVLAAFLARVGLGSPVLFRQQRPGLGGRPFIVLKFRTMTGACDADGKLKPDDERMTPVGRFLRKSSLDELPQLWNVLRGEMSLVGPRPLMMEYLPRYSPEQMRRHDVLPGITGWSQVNGRNAASWPRRLALDVWYVEHWSLRLDAKILALTFWKVFKSEGITRPGRATADTFTGNEALDAMEELP